MRRTLENMEVTVGVDTLGVIVALAVGIVGLVTTVTASARRTRVEVKMELKTELAELKAEFKTDLNRLDERLSRLDDRVSRLDDRVYALAAGLAPRLAPASGETSRDE
jgi:hypothetical protein